MGLNERVLDYKNKDKKSESNDKMKKIFYLSAVTGMSSAFGFSTALGLAKKKYPQHFQQGVLGVGGQESGASLAFRALKWGTLYSVTSTGLVFYGIWKLSGAEDLEDFRNKMGSLLPRIPRNNPPQSRTEFDGLNDLLTYVSEDWSKENKTGSK